MKPANPRILTINGAKCANECVISSTASRITVRMIRTDEELMIAKTVCQVLGIGCKKGN
jgi:acetate kinase